MKIQVQLSLAVLISAMATVSMAKPMPAVIMQDEKAIVPVTKTQVIRKVNGKDPVRTVDTTVLEFKDNGHEIASKDLQRVDDHATFDQDRMANPRYQEKAAIVPSSKIDEKVTVTQGGQVVSEARRLDATGVEFKKDQEPVVKELKMGAVATVDGKVVAAEVSEAGQVQKEVIIVSPGQ